MEWLISVAELLLQVGLVVLGITGIAFAGAVWSEIWKA
jgi:hypothetical protein